FAALDPGLPALTIRVPHPGPEEHRRLAQLVGQRADLAGLDRVDDPLIVALADLLAERDRLAVSARRVPRHPGAGGARRLRSLIRRLTGHAGGGKVRVHVTNDVPSSLPAPSRHLPDRPPDRGRGLPDPR